MKRKEPTANTVNITGGILTGNTIGAGKVDSHADVRIGSVSGGDSEGGRTVADLRAMLIAAQRQIVDAGATAQERTELAYELRKILQELEAETPDPAPVRGRWAQIRDALGPIAGSIAGIAQITDLIGALFRSD